MRRLGLIALALTLALLVAGRLGAETPAEPGEAAASPQSAPNDLTLAAGVKTIAILSMPEGFTAAPWPPVWLPDGEVTVVGHKDGRLTMLGYGGERFEQSRVLAADHGPMAKEGTIWDLAAGPRTPVLAAAVGDAAGTRVEVILRELGAESPERRVAIFMGHFSAAALSWLDSSHLALGLASAPATPEAPTPTPAASPSLSPESGSPTPAESPRAPAASPTAPAHPPAGDPSPASGSKSSQLSSTPSSSSSLATSSSPSPAASSSPSPTPSGSEREAGLYIISLDHGNAIEQLNLRCPRPADFAQMAWSPDGRHALVPSGAMPPLLVDRVAPRCDGLNLPPIDRLRLLGWSPKGARLLYAAAGVNGAGQVGVFEYNIASGQIRQLAAPAAAASYLHDGEVAVFGNRKLTPALIARRPEALLSAELALIDTTLAQMKIVPLGFSTRAPLLLNAGLTYSPAADELAIQVLVPGSGGAVPALLSFFPATLRGAPIATGSADAILSVSWAPDGAMLAVFDTSPSPPVLTILSPPR